ncbi:nicotinate-nucleotide adenylyltransferase [Paenibacillus alkalitolerans]|uniref:nicotinate-nucleotide adenylyltransferase n=1 Tax=Paenibacillus alkalitolerans TaxID=2799335 RepID=UPI0018F36D76|nr:nicotinate-nucleotide adenylyltransferase [Paenibacillus alkalitolerans]
MTRRIGIMGGTFDPIHTGHLIVAERARETGGFDEIWFIPSHQPPHKPPLQGATPADRVKMVEAAIRGNPYFRLERLEINRGGVSYTIDTVIELKRKYPDDQFVWIIGADMVQYLTYWHRMDEIAEHIEFLGVARPGYNFKQAELPASVRGRISFADMPELNISSTEIRDRIRKGLSVRYMLPDQVRILIEENRLYES